MNISALQYVDFDGSSLAPHHAIFQNASGEADINILVDDEDEMEETFGVEMRGPNVGDGITLVNITIVDNEGKIPKTFYNYANAGRWNSS